MLRKYEDYVTNQGIIDNEILGQIYKSFHDMQLYDLHVLQAYCRPSKITRRFDLLITIFICIRLLRKQGMSTVKVKLPHL